MKEWGKVKEELRKLALAIKGSTKEEFPADLANLEDYIYMTFYKNENGCPYLDIPGGCDKILKSQGGSCDGC